MDFEKNPSRKGAKKWWKSRDFSLRFRIENLKKYHEHFFPKAPRQFFQKVDHFLKNPESDPNRPGEVPMKSRKSDPISTWGGPR
jgi:hypothetical protein